MELNRTREKNKSFHLSPDAINALGGSAARRSLDKTSPETDLTTKQGTPNMSKRYPRKTRTPQDEPLEGSNTYSTRSNSKKRAKDSAEAAEAPPTKRGRASGSGRAKTKITGLQALDPEDEDAVYDARAALRGSASPDPDQGESSKEVYIEGDLVYGPGTLIRHASHLAYTEKKQPAAMGACLTILDNSKKIEFPPKFDKSGQPVLGPHGEQLRDIPDVPDKVSTELRDIWYQILLQDMCGATYTDLLHRLNANLPASKFSNRIMNYRLRLAKFSISPNDREISKGSLVVAGKLSMDQLKYNTCWNINKTRMMMRQPKRTDESGWMPLPHPTGDFDTTNTYVKSVLAEINRCKKEAAKAGSTDWLKVFEKEQRAKKAKRHARKGGSYYDEDTIKVGDADSDSSPSEGSARAASIAVDDEMSGGEDATEADIAPTAALTASTRRASIPSSSTLDGLVRAMIDEQLADVQSSSPAPRSAVGARQSSRMGGDIRTLKADNAALVQQVQDLETELRRVRKAGRDQQKWASDAFRDLKSEVEKLKEVCRLR